MSAPWDVFASNPAVGTLGWGLLNFIWQGTLLAFVLRCLLAVLRRQPANLRYWTATVTLFVMPLVTAATLSKPRTPDISFSRQQPVGAPRLVSPPSASEPGTTDADQLVSPIPERREPDPRTSDTPDAGRWLRDVQARLPGSLAGWMAAFWILGVLVVSTTTLAGLLQTGRVRRGARDIVPDRELSDLIRTSDVGVPVRLLESRHVLVPTVIGWRRPVVLFPAGSTLDPEHTRALLAHELAHIRRRDYLVNVLQAVVEIALFYHPAVWWTSGRVRTERECCCDDAAVALCGDLRRYVRALSEAERQLSASKFAVAFGGAPLLSRIRRLTDMKAAQHTRSVVWTLGTASVAVMLGFSMASTVFAVIPARDTATVAPAAAALVTSPPPAPAGPGQIAALTVPARRALPVAAVPASVAAGPDAQQSTPLTITGTVFDPTGDAVVPGASISVVDADTKRVLADTTSKVNGAFEISSPTANYYMQVALAGFETQVLKASQIGSRPLRIQMELNAVDEVVTATSESAAATAAPNARIRVGGNLAAPKLVTRTDPVYPAEARDAGIEGSVLVSAHIGKDGSVTNATALSGHRLLRDAAVACVSQWVFRPARVNGEPWPMRLSVTVVFRLQQ